MGCSVMKKIAEPKDAREMETKKKAKSFKDKKKNMQRLGGGRGRGRGGLSLEAFANAKTRSNTYNPAVISNSKPPLCFNLTLVFLL